MSWISHDFLCRECGELWDKVVRRSERDELQECPECGSVAGERQLSAPLPLRASYHDGYRRGQDYQILKEASHLEVQAAKAGTREERDALQRESNRLKRVSRTKRPKATDAGNE